MKLVGPSAYLEAEEKIINYYVFLVGLKVKVFKLPIMAEAN